MESSFRENHVAQLRSGSGSLFSNYIKSSDYVFQE